MTFLAPWALALGALGALGMVLLHLVARQRPAAYFLPTTRFVPDKRTLVSRAATRPRDLLLLAIRVLLVLAAAAAFARPVLTPSRGAIARVVLVDRSRAVLDASDAAARVRAISGDGAPLAVIGFDSMPVHVAPDSLGQMPLSGARGSLSAALIAARRAAVALADKADSVQLVLVSPVMAGELDGATARVRAEWPGAIRIERVAARVDSSSAWHLERALPISNALGPAVVRQLPTGLVSRLVRGALSAADSAFARDGGTVVRWDSTAAKRPAAEGLSANGEVIVASLERIAVPDGRVLARWADGTAATSETVVGKGCLRTVGVAIPAAGDLALHPPFQRITRSLLAPCGVTASDHAADSSAIQMLSGPSTAAASGAVLRATETRPSPLAPWLLGVALLLALAELAVRARAVPVPT